MKSITILIALTVWVTVMTVAAVTASAPLFAASVVAFLVTGAVLA